MPDAPAPSRVPASWPTLPLVAGVVAVLYFARELLIPLALSILLRKFRPEYVGAEPPGINATVTLTPKGGLKFKIHER